MARRRTSLATAASGLLSLFPLAILFLTPRAASGQPATVRVAENFRAEPNGDVVGRLEPGATLVVAGRSGGWLEVVLEGWVWIRSLQVTDRGGFDLVVSADEGENLRAEPRGAVMARLPSGTLLEEAERIPGWIRARRRGWVWAESVDVGALEGAGDAGAEAPAPEDEPDSPGDAARDPPGRELITAPSGGLPVLAAPDGDTLGRARAGTDVEVTDRQGGWARVRLEGWAWVPAGAAAEDGSGGPARPVDATPDEVRAEPGRFVGRVVTWELQYVSLERAERVRTDFFEGEPFLLTRIPGGEGAFVYVAVPPDRLGLVDGLTPLERVRVTGRIRSGASALTGSPILDLLELRRVGR